MEVTKNNNRYIIEKKDTNNRFYSQFTVYQVLENKIIFVGKYYSNNIQDVINLLWGGYITPF